MNLKNTIEKENNAMDENIIDFKKVKEINEESNTKSKSENTDFDIGSIFELVTSNPELIPGIVHVLIEKYKPIIYGTLNELVVILEDYANNKKIREINAVATKNTYDAYVAAGFTEDQAFSLLMKDANQSAKSSAELSNLVKQIIDLMENK